jgi:hypothetical protein
MGTSNQPASGTGPGDLQPDVVIEGTGVAARTVRLRAETAPTGPARVYSLTGTATDQAGHSASVTGTCTVVTGSGSCASTATNQFAITRSGFRFNNATGRFLQTVTITKNSFNVQPLSGPFALVVDGLSSNATLFQSAGTTVCAAPAGSPYILLNPGSTWSTGQTVTATLEFTNPSRTGITYTPRIIAGGTSR